MEPVDLASHVLHAFNEVLIPSLDSLSEKLRRRETLKKSLSNSSSKDVDVNNVLDVSNLIEYAPVVSLQNAIEDPYDGIMRQWNELDSAYLEPVSTADSAEAYGKYKNAAVHRICVPRGLNLHKAMSVDVSSTELDKEQDQTIDATEQVTYDAMNHPRLPKDPIRKIEYLKKLHELFLNIPRMSDLEAHAFNKTTEDTEEGGGEMLPLELVVGNEK